MNEPEVWQSASGAVVERVAEAEGVDPLDLDPLYEAIDPDALDKLCGGADYDARSSARIVFDYNGYTVVVDGPDSVTLAGERTPNEPAWQSPK